MILNVAISIVDDITNGAFLNLSSIKIDDITNGVILNLSSFIIYCTLLDQDSACEDLLEKAHF